MVTGIYARALAAVPQYAAADSAVATVKAALADLQADRPRERTAVEAELREALLDGQPVPDDLPDRLDELDRATRRWTHEVEVLDRVRRDLEAQRTSCLTPASTVSAFELLAAELAEILDAVRDVGADLGPARTADQAAAADKAAAWVDLTGLVERYDRLRAAQFTLAPAAGLGGGVHQAQTLLEDHGLLRNQLDVDPFLAERLVPPAGDDPVTGAPATPTPENILLSRCPWPAAKHPRGRRWWPTTDRPAYLVWCASDEPEPWVPTIDELHAHRAAVEAAARQAAAEDLGPGESPQRRARRLRAFEAGRAEREAAAARAS